jgi:hypothetical protein
LCYQRPTLHFYLKLEYEKEDRANDQERGRESKATLSESLFHTALSSDANEKTHL